MKGSLIYKNLSLKSIRGEKWKDCVFVDTKGNKHNYKGYYMVSNLGRVKSLKRTRVRKNGSPISTPERILRAGVRKADGYLIISFHKKGNKSFLVANLVGRMFIPNPLNKRTINHKWGIVTDNRVSQLEWNTDSENNKHSYAVLGRRHFMLGKTGGECRHARAVIWVETGRVFDTAKGAAKELKCDQSGITLCCQHKRKYHHGRHFEYYTPSTQD